MRVAAFSGSAADWNAFVSAQAGRTAFHRAELAEVTESVFRHEVMRLAAYADDGALAAVLPLVRVRSRVFGHFLVSMPFVSYGGPLGSDDGIRALATHAHGLATTGRADLLELRSARPLPIDLPVSHRKITVVLRTVPGDTTATFNSFKSKLRSQVRRPAKDGVEVRMGPDQVRPFFEVFARHMRDLGTPAMPRAWFEGLARAYGDDFWVATAWHNDQPIAGGAGFRWDGEFEITWASALRSHGSLSPNMAVYWTLIERCAAEGLGRFNFGRCSPDSPTHKFKSQWGAVDEALYWYQGSASRVGATPNAGSGAFELASRVWRKLPLPVATALGPHIVRSIP
jgi:serine/alanine adding enzyme